ncbi:MAG: ECF-type sigma factor [Lysobacteraceae bacterium]
MEPSSVTQLLDAWKRGDRSVENELAIRIYPVLRDIARSQVRRNAGVLTLSATELANEAYERLHDQRSVDWRNRQHFFAIAATVIRRVVIDYLRMRSADKRGGDVVFVALDESQDAEEEALQGKDLIDWLALDHAMSELAEVDADCARVVELRLFSGLTVEEVAAVLDSSTATVGRQWRFSRAWLSQRLSSNGSMSSND